jgi:hypothetical protein
MHIFLAFPTCANAELQTSVQVARYEATKLTCLYHSSTQGPLEFKWSLNSSKDFVDFPKSQFTTEGDKSVLSFSAKTDMDYGNVACIGIDSVGRAVKPCTFNVVPKGNYFLVIINDANLK